MYSQRDPGSVVSKTISHRNRAQDRVAGGRAEKVVDARTRERVDASTPRSSTT